MFILDRKPPIPYAEAASRSEGPMFRKLLKVALENPGLNFWKEMASKETQAKGKRGRELKLILPDNYEDSSDEELDPDWDDETLSDDESSTGPGKTDGAQLPANALSSSTGRSAIGPTALSFPGENSSFLTYAQGGSNPRTGSKKTLDQASLDTGSQRLTVMPRGQPPASTGQAPSSRRIEGNSNTIEPEPKIEREEESKGDVFALDLRTAIEHVFRREEDADDIVAIFHDLVSIRDKPEFESIRAWLSTREFKPRLVHLPVNGQAIVSDNLQSQGSDN